MSVSGFFDPGAARAVVRRMKLRQALGDASVLASRILDRLDQQLETKTGAAPADGAGGVDLAGGDGEGGVRAVPVHRIERDDLREQELLQGVNLVLQFLNSLLGEIDHGRFSSTVCHSPNANPAGPGGASSK